MHWLCRELRKIRHERGLTQTQLADLATTERCPITHRAIQNYEAGTNEPPIGKIDQLFKALGYELELKAIG